MIEPKQLLEGITDAFINQDKYLFDKHVPEFKLDGKFLGDCFSQIAVEPQGKLPPRFYHTFSPFDVISNKAPDRALVFEAGNLILETDFAEYVHLRTAAMSVVIMQALGIKSLTGKKVLLFGAGNVAQASLKFLKTAYSELEKVECISRTNNFNKLSGVAKTLGLQVVPGALKDIGTYDVIICHTQSSEAILNKESRERIKNGAFIATFISSTEHGEVDDSYYDAEKANIICDWEQTTIGAKDLSRALSHKQLSVSDIIFLKDLLTEAKKVNPNKSYTIYRSAGTPVQNLAVLKLLLKKTQTPDKF